MITPVCSQTVSRRTCYDLQSLLHFCQCPVPFWMLFLHLCFEWLQAIHESAVVSVLRATSRQFRCKWRNQPSIPFYDWSRRLASGRAYGLARGKVRRRAAYHSACAASADTTCKYSHNHLWWRGNKGHYELHAHNNHPRRRIPIPVCEQLIPLRQWGNASYCWVLAGVWTEHEHIPRTDSSA